MISRAARRLGDGMTFDPSGEALWAHVRSELEALLGGLLRAGALGGESAEQGFQVRCDRTTMTQNDTDNGRVIASVQFAAAAPVELIRVTLAMAEGGMVTLTPGTRAQQEAAA